MPQSYFIWNGEDCRSKGITLRGPVPIVKPEERVKHTEIPGRAGDLTELEGEDIYNPYIQTASISVRGASNVREVYKWLRGSGYVTFSGEPERKQQARIIGAVTLNKVSRNLDKWVGEVQFYCQPLKEQLSEEAIEVTENLYIIENPGDVASRPLITIDGSGTVSLMTVEETLILYNVESGWVIDCENEWVMKNGVPLTGVYSGKFLRFPPGYDVLQFTGDVNKLTIQGRWRYL